MVIVNMDMPESCHKCCCYDVDYQRCVISSIGIPNRYYYDGSIRPEWCPIICGFESPLERVRKMMKEDDGN